MMEKVTLFQQERLIYLGDHRPSSVGTGALHIADAAQTSSDSKWEGPLMQYIAPPAICTVRRHVLTLQHRPN